MERILVIDDSPVQANLLKSILDDTYDVTTVHTAESGLHYAKSGDYSLILLDVIMPSINGFEVLALLQKDSATQHIPVVLITSLSDFQNEERGLTLGAVDYISKPSMELDNGDAILQRILEKYEQRNNKAVPPKEMGEELAAIWEVCRTQHWFFSDGAFERLKELISQVEPKASNVRRLEMMIARYIGELEGMLELPEIMVPLFSDTEEIVQWLSSYRSKVYESMADRSLGSDAERILKAVIYMKEHLEEDLSTSTVAEYIGCSRSYFCIIFKKLSGLSFGDYLQQVRIERAKELLLNSSDSVTEIAFSSGYNDIYYFNRVFRKAVNCSPMEFRKNRGRTGG